MVSVEHRAQCMMGSRISWIIFHGIDCFTCGTSQLDHTACAVTIATTKGWTAAAEGCDVVCVKTSSANMEAFQNKLQVHEMLCGG